MSLHISTSPQAKPAPSVLMPGDPLRAQFIAENYLDGAVRYSEIRNMYGYTGTYKGVPVSVQGSGMGMPSMGIYSYELFTAHGVENIIRIGTAGSFNPTIKVGDIVCGLAASTDSNYQHAFDVPGLYAPCASYGLLQKLQAASEDSGIPFTAGNIVSCDVFYETTDDWWKRQSEISCMYEYYMYGKWIDGSDERGKMISDFFFTYEGRECDGGVKKKVVRQFLKDSDANG